MASALEGEAFERFGDWMVRHRADMQCPMCSNTGWTPGPVLWMPIAAEGTITTGIRLVPVTCGRCGYTFFLNSYVAEIEDPPGLLDS